MQGMGNADIIYLDKFTGPDISIRLGSFLKAKMLHLIIDPPKPLLNQMQIILQYYALGCYGSASYVRNTLSLKIFSHVVPLGFFSPAGPVSCDQRPNQVRGPEVAV